MPRALVLLILFCLFGDKTNAAGIDTFRFHTDFVYLNDDNKLMQDFYYSSDSAFSGILDVACYKYDKPNDSILVFAKKNKTVKFKSGINHASLNYSENDENTYYLPVFYTILQKQEVTPPGAYKIFVSISSSDKNYNLSFIYNIDSNLSANSSIRRQVNKTLLPKSKSILGINVSNVASNYTKAAGTALDQARGKINRFYKKRGLTPVEGERDGKKYIDFYYQDWFVGRYEVNENLPIKGQIQQQAEGLESNMGSFTTNDLGDYHSLFSQFRELKKDKKDNQEIQGELSVLGNMSSGQEQYSGIDNNFYEVRGLMQLPVMGMPVDIEGYYTSQDNNRQAKASYIHFHYDVDQAKGELTKLINAYNQKYSETVSKGQGLQMVYGSAINSLQGERNQLLGSLQQQTGASNIQPGHVNIDSLKQVATQQALTKAESDTAMLRQKMMHNADSSGAGQNAQAARNKEQELQTKEAQIKDSVAKKYQKIQEEYNKILVLEQKIQKYQALLSQYKNTTYFDSALAYSKMKGMSNPQDMSYKDMAKQADNILPNGKVKSFTTGITSFDAGMFPKYESQFTMAGQQVKGTDFGYDLGICKAGVTLGSTEYIDAGGNVDKYTTYSGRAIFDHLPGQKVELIYYGYTPSRNAFSGDGFYKDVNVAMPSFREPVSIFSLNYANKLSRYVLLNAEVATSSKRADTTNVIDNVSMGDKMAYSATISGNIPATTISIDGSFDKVGKNFENNTLPLVLNGTTQYKIAATGDFFRSILTLGIEYDYMLQDNFSSVGTATARKWGFNIKTNTRRYPSLSLSYKPFTTFRSYTDTLNIPQRPLLGSVWTGRLSYQLKMHDGRSIRLMATYNKSTSQMDTTRYGSNLAQATCIYMVRDIMATLTIGNMQLSGNEVSALVATPNNTKFMDLVASKTLSKQLSVTAGQDIGIAGFGFCRYSAIGGLMYRLKDKPITARLNMRYNTYELNAGTAWKNLYSGDMEVIWQFRAKMKNK